MTCTDGPHDVMQTCSDPFGLVGSMIAGRYAVEELVGEGGFSVVYRARHVLWDRPVAIKAFRGFEHVDAEAQARLLRAFVQEGAILAELSERSTAIVQARDTATLVTEAGDWVPYLVLEWLPGETLEAVLWRERREGMPPRRLADAVSLLEPIARALEVAHGRGICHRDLKPGNLVLQGDARDAGVTTIKLLDFGTAGFFSEARRSLAASRADGSRARDVSGFTPSYGAPEQFSPAYGVTGPWTDVFALALIVVELVSGCEPMGEGRSLQEYAEAATYPRWRPTPRAIGADVTDAVEAVFGRALAVFPAERWQTVGSFWRALRSAMEQPPAEQKPASRPLRVAPAAAFALAVALAGCPMPPSLARSAPSAAPVSSVAGVAPRLRAPPAGDDDRRTRPAGDGAGSAVAGHIDAARREADPDEAAARTGATQACYADTASMGPDRGAVR